MSRRTTTKPFDQLDLDDQVQMRQLARRMLLTGHPQPVDDMSLLPDVVRTHAQVTADSTDPDRSVFEQLARVHAVSFSLGIAIGQLAPWIGDEARKAGRR